MTPLTERSNATNIHTPTADTQQLAPTVNLGRVRKTKNRQPAEKAPAQTTPCTTLNGGNSIVGTRAKNEDSFLVDAERHLWAVSDGIGGAPFGEVISRVSCNYLSHAWEAAAPLHPEIPDRLETTIRLVDSYVSQLSDLLGNEGSGATLTVAHYDDHTLHLASIGDSRSFLLRESTLKQISNDGRVSTMTNALDQALGYHMALKPDITSFVPQPGDVLVICTDGVWATQSLESMLRAITEGMEPDRLAVQGNPQRMAYRLTQGSDMTDNATAVVVLFQDAKALPLLTPSV